MHSTQLKCECEPDMCVCTPALRRPDPTYLVEMGNAHVSLSQHTGGPPRAHCGHQSFVVVVIVVLSIILLVRTHTHTWARSCSNPLGQTDHVLLYCMCHAGVYVRVCVVCMPLLAKDRAGMKAKVLQFDEATSHVAVYVC